MRILAALASISMAISAPIEAQDASMGGKISGTGRDLYVACYLLLAGAKVENTLPSGEMVLPYSPEACVTTQLAMLANVPSGKSNPDIGCWEIPKSPEANANWPHELARLYVKNYEHSASQLGNSMGISAMLFVALKEWPCK